MGTPLPKYFDSNASRVVARWLAMHPDCEVLTDRDCNCDDDIRSMRTESDGIWRPNPDYHPYYVTGDFRADHQIDLAVGVKCVGENMRVLIVHDYRNAPRDNERIFLSRTLYPHTVIFFGPPRDKPYRLVVGPFSSEGIEFEPKRDGGYALGGPP